MKKLIIATAFILLAGVAFGQNWSSAGSHPNDYNMGGDPTVKHGTENSGFIKSIASDIDGFGTWMIQIEADKYIGKRIRLSGYVKSKEVEDWAGLWMRVDGASTTSLSFDNMEDRPIKGTTKWKKYEIVLDVPENSTGIFYGIILVGKGQAWVDGLQLETVSNEIPVTEPAVFSMMKYFEQGKYKEANELFQTYFKADNPDGPFYIYNHLFYFISLYRAGEVSKAQSHISEFSNAFKDDTWIAPVAHFYAGKITEDAVLKLAENEDDKKDIEQKCEAYYYIGMMHTLKENLSKAKDYFKKCVTTDVKYFSEYGYAKEELERINE